jgi:hypothetical protein
VLIAVVRGDGTMRRSFLDEIGSVESFDRQGLNCRHADSVVDHQLSDILAVEKDNTRIDSARVINRLPSRRTLS